MSPEANVQTDNETPTSKGRNKMEMTSQQGLSKARGCGAYSRVATCVVYVRGSHFSKVTPAIASAWVRKSRTS